MFQFLPVFASFCRFFPLSWQKYFLPWQKPNPAEMAYIGVELYVCMYSVRTCAGEDMHKVKANLFVISLVIYVLLVHDVATEPDVDEREVHCYDCQPADPDAKRNVVS